MNNRMFSNRHGGASRNTTFGLAVLLALFGAARLAAQDQVWWTGDVSNDWATPGNWQGSEVPGTGNQAVFAMPDANHLGDVSLPSDNYALHSLLVNNQNDGADVNITGTLTSTQYLTFGVNGGIKMEAGVGDVRIQLGHQSAQYRLQRTGTTTIENGSSSTLRIHGSFVRDPDTSGSDPKVSVTGTGDIRIERDLGATAGEWTLDSNFTGRLICQLGVSTNQAVVVNGGTLVLNAGRSARFSVAALTVNNGVLSGSGLFGGTTDPTRNLTINFNSGAIVDPGLAGTTGTMTFTNFEVPFHAGSTLRLDLLDKDDHDSLAFTDVGGFQNAWLTLDTAGSGVALDLNFLPGFSADFGHEFVILDGYESIAGTFAGLPDKHEWEEGGVEFRIDYGTSATTLTVIPEPGTLGLLLGAGALLALRRRATARG